jgi:anti-sigma regulatory factor (Ser/Thr protein kinase)
MNTVIASNSFAGTERSAAAVRRFARETVGDAHPSLDDIQMCVNEAFTNGIEHTASGRGGQVIVAFVAEGDGVLVEVTDEGAGGERPRLESEFLGESGRGMWIIDALAREWGVREDGERTTVWMSFPGAVMAG